MTGRGRFPSAHAALRVLPSPLMALTAVQFAVLAAFSTARGLQDTDGRMHKYGGSVLDDYSTVVAVDAGWEKLVDRYGVEALLLRVDTPLIRGPAQADGWCEAYRDDLQVLLLKSCA